MGVRGRGRERGGRFTWMTLIIWLIAIGATAGYADDDLRQAVAQLGSAGRSERMQADEMLLSAGAEAVPLLLEALDRGDHVVRTGAIQVLRELRAREAVPKLIGLLNGPDTPTALASVFALGKIRDHRATEPLIALLASEGREELKGAAVIGLGYLGDLRAVPALQKELRSDDQRRGIFAAGSLGLLGDKSGLREALDGAESQDRTIRLHAIQALGLIGDRRAKGRLQMALNDPAGAWKADVELSLTQIEYYSLERERQLSLLETCLGHKNQKLVEWAIQELAVIGTPGAVKLLEDRARSHQDTGSYLARRALKALDRSAKPVRSCASVGKMCGGIAGFLCCPGLTCMLDGNYPDAGGACRE